MFSALKRFSRKQEEKVFPSGIAPVDQKMQKKYAKGVQYNMKIIIKGDRNTGKSALLHRLTGSDFKEEYIPTHEIQVANVNWNYRGAEDVVKVEVWDIVDKSQKKKNPSDGLKIQNEPVNPADGMVLDAEFVNVYKGTHGVIIIFDITKAWTWQYAQKELDKIPMHIPVLILANFHDMHEHKVLQTDEVIAFIEHYERPSGSAEIYFSECSVKEGFGLTFIYKFLNMPFLILQRETLLRQLEANTLEIEETREALCIDSSSAEQSYDQFKLMFSQKINPEIPADSKYVSSSDLSKVNEGTKEDAVKLKAQTSHSSNTTKQLPVATVSPTVYSTKPETDKVNTEPLKPSRFQIYKSKLFGGEVEPKESSDNLKQEVAVNNVDEFVPDQLDSEFLNAPATVPPEKKHNLTSGNVSDDSEDDDNDENPIIACYEDLESDASDNVAFDKPDSGEEFDDLSDNEKPVIKESEVSIFKQVKSNKLKDNSNNKDTYKSDYPNTKTDLSYEYDEIGIPDDERELHDELNLSVSKTIESINSQSLNSNILSKKDQEIIKETSDHIENIENSDTEDNAYEIAATIEEDWMQDSANESDSKDEKGKNFKNATVNEKKTTLINFDVDDLEVFMQSQLQKTLPKVEEVSKVKETKKKKKTVQTGETVEKVKRKKKPRANELKNEEATNGTNTSKSKYTDTVKNSEALNTVKKTKSSGEKKKKTKSSKANRTSEDALDSFFAT